MQNKEYEEHPVRTSGCCECDGRLLIRILTWVAFLHRGLGMNGEQNFAYGLDGIFRLFGDDYLNVKGAQSYDKTIGNELASLDPSFLMVQWERRSEKGLGYNFNYSYTGQQFTPGIGFVQRPGIQGFEGTCCMAGCQVNNQMVQHYCQGKSESVTPDCQT